MKKKLKLKKRIELELYKQEKKFKRSKIIYKQLKKIQKTFINLIQFGVFIGSIFFKSFKIVNNFI